MDPSSIIVHRFDAECLQARPIGLQLNSDKYGGVCARKSLTIEEATYLRDRLTEELAAVVSAQIEAAAIQIEQAA